VADILWGSLGVVEEFFGASLGEDGGRLEKVSVITPDRIIMLPIEQRRALGVALAEFQKEAPQRLADYRSSLQRSQEPVGRPTMLIRDGQRRGLAVHQTLRVMTYCRRVFVDDPVEVNDPWREMGIYSDAHLALRKLARLRPLITGGYLAFFPESLIRDFQHDEPNIVEEIARRSYEREMQRVDDEFVDEEEEWCGLLRPMSLKSYYDPILNRLATSIGLRVDAIDTTGDKYVLSYLGKSLTPVPTRLAHFDLPRLELLNPRDLAALLSSDAALAEVHYVLDNTFRNIPDGLCGDVKGAAQWIDDRLSDDFKDSVRKLKRTVRSTPAAAKIGSAGAAVGATLVAGILTASPAIALGVGAAGAAADLAGSWLHEARRHRKNEPALRVLMHLASPTAAQQP
jgi:hypothetical protein